MKVGTKTENETETENDIVSGFFQKMFDFFRICWHPKFPDNPTTSRKTVFAYDFTPSAPFRLTKNGTPMVPAAAPVRFPCVCNAEQRTRNSMKINFDFYFPFTNNLHKTSKRQQTYTTVSAFIFKTSTSSLS